MNPCSLPTYNNYQLKASLVSSIHHPLSPQSHYFEANPRFPITSFLNISIHTVPLNYPLCKIRMFVSSTLSFLLPLNSSDNMLEQFNPLTPDCAAWDDKFLVSNPSQYLSTGRQSFWQYQKKLSAPLENLQKLQKRTKFWYQPKSSRPYNYAST